MADKCKIECTECGNEMGLIGRTGWSELDIDSLSEGDTIESMCMGDCDEPMTEHVVINILD